MFARGVSVPFVAGADDVASTTADGASPVIEARVRGGSARSIAVFLNGKAAGVWPLEKGETRVVTLKLATEGASAPQLVTGTNELLLRFKRGPHTFTLFPDGRALIQGTTDITLARSLYARFIGS